MIETEERAFKVEPSWLLRAGVSKRHIDTSIDHPDIQGFEYVRQVKNYGARIKEMAVKGIGLILSGPYGVGKTSLATYLMKEALGRGGTAYMVRAGRVSSLCINGGDYEEGLSYPDLFERVDLLVVDNLNAELTGKWAAEKFEDIIRERWGDRRPTIVTTNLAPKDLDQVVSPGSVSLLRDCCYPVVVHGKAWRESLDPRDLSGGE